MLLSHLAHARTGDKGNIVTISLIAFHQGDFNLLDERITPERVADHFSELIEGSVQRYSLPQLGALNFVLHRSKSHSVTRSLYLDAHGKCLASALLSMEI